MKFDLSLSWTQHFLRTCNKSYKKRGLASLIDFAVSSIGARLRGSASRHCASCSCSVFLGVFELIGVWMHFAFGLVSAASLGDVPFA
jgi:hypothetical protein